MKRRWLVLPNVWAGSFAAVMACTTVQKSPPSEPPRVLPDPAAQNAHTGGDAGDAAASGAGSAASISAAWAKDWPKTWTDPRVVRALASSCDFVPGPAPGRGEESWRPDIFTCTLGYAQSCAMDPCLVGSDHCEAQCGSSCVGCGGACAASCASCKSACKDEGCRMACASSCAECRQTCTRTMDRCVSGDCSKVHDGCTKRVTAAWKRNGCAPKCAAFRHCQEGCSDQADVPGCHDRCETKHLTAAYATCLEKCETVADAGPDTQSLCHARCLESTPCSSLMCMMGLGAR